MAEQLRKRKKQPESTKSPKEDTDLSSKEKTVDDEAPLEPTSSSSEQTTSNSQTSAKNDDVPLDLDTLKNASDELQEEIDPVKKIEEEFEDLSILEKYIINIAKSVLKKKRYEATIKTQRPENMSPLVEELYDKCVAKLTHTRGFSRDEIFHTIQKLHDEKWIITDQRRTRKEILASETLRKVLEFIHDNPGTHARNDKIQDVLGITRNPFIKHVMVLEAFGLIRSKKIGRTLNYFVTELPEKYDDFVVLFSNPMVPQIIIEFLKDPDISLSEIARKLDVYHGAIQYHVKKFKKKEILIKHDKNWVVNKKLLTDYNKMFDVPPFFKYL